MTSTQERNTPLRKKIIGVSIGLGLLAVLIYIYRKHGFGIPWFGPQTTMGKAIIYSKLWKMLFRNNKK